MSEPRQMRILFAAYASGEISDDEVGVLEAALREDDSLRQAFIEYLNIDSALGDIAALTDAEIAEVDEVRAKLVAQDRPARSAPAWWRTLAFAGGVAALLAIVLSLWIPISAVKPAATMVARIDAVLNSSDEKVWNRQELPPGGYTLERGLVHLRFAGDVMVYLEAPAQFVAVNDRKMILHHGRLSASVPPAGTGFTVETPEAEVIDFGTEFSIDVESGASEVHVFKGEVSVQPRPVSDQANSIQLRTAEAVRIDKTQAQPRRIKLATDRFIRSFDEPQRSYPSSVTKLKPLAHYRMPIRDRGLVCEPPQFSGEVLTGEGNWPPHARGFIGGSLRVLAGSAGRGGLVRSAPPMTTGQLTLVAHVFAETNAGGETVITNIHQEGGNFDLSVDENGMLKATVRTAEGAWQSCSSSRPLPLGVWHHVIMIADGEHLRLFEAGELAATSECSVLQPISSGSLFFGTTSDGTGLWNGRIDEVAIFDRALNASEVAKLFKAAGEQLSESR